MKLALVFATVALAITQNISAQSSTYKWGSKEVNDRQLFLQVSTKQALFLQTVTEDVKYSGTTPISYIQVIDQYTNGNGGYVNLTSGGVGSNEASFHLKSQRGYGFNFIIEIFGI